MKSALVLLLAAPTVRVMAPVAPAVLAGPQISPGVAASPLPIAAFAGVLPSPLPVPAAPLALLQGIGGRIRAAAVKGDARPSLDAAFDQGAIADGLKKTLGSAFAAAGY